MRLGFTGTRHGMTETQRGAWIDLLSCGQFTQVHFGGCVGADKEALWLWAEIGSGVCHIWPAIIEPELQALPPQEVIEMFGIVMHQPMRPLVRNRMIVHHVDIMFATPHATLASRGTRYTMAYARECGVELHVAS